MTDQLRPITDRDSFREHLRTLLAAAEASGVDVTGAYDCETEPNHARYDVQVSTVRR